MFKNVYKLLKFLLVTVFILAFIFVLWLIQQKLTMVIISVPLGLTLFKLVLSLFYTPITANYYSKKKTITAIMPNYNEKLTNVQRGFITLLNQDYEIDQFIFVDDGSDNTEVYDYVKKISQTNDKILALRTEKNQGKKAAQLLAFQYVKSEYVLLFDTDSLLDEDSLGNLMKGFDDYDIGAVVGTIKVSNLKRNFIVKMQELLYTSAFRFSRSAQSVTGCVSVCSGAFSVFNFRLIKKNLHKFTEKKAGMDLAAGDDRILTAMVLEAGYKTKYQSNAFCYTEVPTTLRTFLKQQIRWAKSGFILAVYSLKLIFRNPFIPFWQWMDAYMWMINSVISLTLFGQGLIAAFGNGIILEKLLVVDYQGIFVFAMYFLLNYAITNIYMFRENKALFFTGYVHKTAYVFILMVIRIRAILTIRKGGWGTR